MRSFGWFFTCVLGLSAAGARAQAEQDLERLPPDLRIATVCNLDFVGIFGNGEHGSSVFKLQPGMAKGDAADCVVATGFASNEPHLSEDGLYNAPLIHVGVKRAEQAKKDFEARDHLLEKFSPELALTLITGFTFVGMLGGHAAVYSVPNTVSQDDAYNRVIGSGLARSTPRLLQTSNSETWMFAVKLINHVPADDTAEQ